MEESYQMKTVFACLMLVVLASLAVAQKTKPWTEWSKKDIEKTLSDSAWAQTQNEGDDSQASSSSTAITQVGAQGTMDRDLKRPVESGETKPTKVVKYHVRFLSAKPIRAAFARMVMLAQAQPNEELNTKLQEFVDRNFADYIVISVGVEVGDQQMAAGLMRAFTAATTEALQKSVYLERKDGKKLFLMEYRAPTQDGMGAKFVFQRMVEGQPFLAQDDSVRFVAQLNEKMKLNTKYKLADMLYDGKLEY